MNITQLTNKLQNRLVAELPNLFHHSLRVNIECSSTGKKACSEVYISAYAYPKDSEGGIDFNDANPNQFIFFYKTKKGLADALSAFDEKLLGVSSLSKLNIEDNE